MKLIELFTGAGGLAMGCAKAGFHHLALVEQDKHSCYTVHGVPGGENMLALPDGQVRYFTVREAARLQTFPDDYYFPCTWGESMRQIGNAVPVNLAHLIAGSIRSHLQELPLLGCPWEPSEDVE